MTATLSSRRSTSAVAWFAPVPERRIEIVRTVTFGYAVVWLILRARYVWDVSGLPARRFEPVGILDPLGSPPAGAVVMSLWALTLAGAAAAAAGKAPRLSATVGSIGMLVIATLTSSFGQVFHTEHLLVLHLLILAASSLVDPAPAGGERSGWPLNLMMAVVVVAYVVAGVAKLRFGGTDWLTGDLLRNWVAVDNLRKLLLDDLHSPAGGWLAGTAWVWGPVAVVTLLVELGAPVALLPGRLRLAWVAAAWAFHVGVVVLMAITFPYQLSGVAYLAFLDVERIENRLRRRFSRPPLGRPANLSPGASSA